MWLDPVHAVLDRLERPVTCFFRDDDAGWDDASLFALLDAFASHGMPLDLAVIPDAVTASLAQALRARRRATPHLVGWHQHGFRHCNHEPAGRKCEFGAARVAEAQHRDLAAGRARLEDHLDGIDPLFTPPWNRCSQATVDGLVSLGFTALSRDETAAPLDLRGLAAMPVHVDACKRDGDAWEPVGLRLAQALSRHRTVGVMLHHAVMTAADRNRTGELLALLSAHPRAGARLMREVPVAVDPPVAAAVA